MAKAIVVLLAFTIVGCNSSPGHQGNLDYFIPEASFAVIKTNSITDLANDLGNNTLFLNLSNESWYKSAANKLAPLTALAIKQEGLICVQAANDSVMDITLITTLHDKLLVGDSIPRVDLDNLINGTLSLDPITLGEFTYHTTVVDSIVIASTSQAIAENAKTYVGLNSPDFKRLNASIGQSAPAIFLRKSDNANWQKTLLTPNSDPESWTGQWTGLSLELAPGGLRFSGITTLKDSLNFLNSFKTSTTDSITAGRISPRNALALISYTYQDFQALQFTDSITPIAELVGSSSSELSGLVLEESKAMLAKTIDPLIAMEFLAPYINPQEPFRGISRFTLNDSLGLENLIKPVLDSVALTTVFAIDSYLVFAQDLSSSETLIQSYLSNNTLAQDSSYKEALSNLGTTCHVMAVAKSPYAAARFNSWVNSEFITGLEPEKFKDHDLFALQLTQENSYAHLHGIAKEKAMGTSSNGIRELFTITPENALLKPPQFFTNHRTRGKDIVFQDVQNTLFFYASNGKLLWSKKLDGPILGNIKEVDLLRNGKKQLAFNTARSLTILDRNGNPVAPFPINFRDPVTQPVAVFDYDNNRKYRFVIVQDNELLMYDSKAKIVKGFTFTQAESALAFAPQHMRMGNRDYIVMGLTNGSLLIKSRVGKDRIKINQSFDFGSIAPYNEDGNFVVIDAQYTKYSISQSGAITSKALGVAEEFSIELLGKSKVSLDENLLRINGRLYELPYGVYSAPRIFQLGRTQYFTVTDLQEQKVYVFNSDADLIPNFPIYGSGPAVLGDANKNRRTNILVPGDQNTILLYELQ